MRAGVAKVNITPPVGTYLQGYVRGRPSAGVLNDLYARALVFENDARRMALVAADIIGLDPPSVDRIRNAVRRSTGIPGQNLMLACSHTHCAQAMMDLCRWTDPPDEHTVRETERKIAARPPPVRRGGRNRLPRIGRMSARRRTRRTSSASS